MLVEHRDEPRGPALRRHVAGAVGVGGADEHERGTGDELATVQIEAVDLFVARPLVRRLDDLTQRILVTDDAGEGL